MVMSANTQHIEGCIAPMGSQKNNLNERNADDADASFGYNNANVKAKTLDICDGVYW